MIANGLNVENAIGYIVIGVVAIVWIICWTILRLRGKTFFDPDDE